MSPVRWLLEFMEFRPFDVCINALKQYVHIRVVYVQFIAIYVLAKAYIITQQYNAYNLKT